MTRASVLLALVTGVVVAIPTAQAAVKFDFVQSQEVEAPAAAGFKRGITLRGPVARAEWPTDRMPSVPTSRLAKTRLGMEYARNIAYPAYAGWVRIGNAAVGLVIAGIGLAVYLGRGVRKHA